MSTFAAKLKANNRGLVISVNGSGLGEEQRGNQWEGEADLRVIRLQLATEMTLNHHYTQINEPQLRKLVNSLTTETEENLYRSVAALDEIKPSR